MEKSRDIATKDWKVRKKFKNAKSKQKMERKMKYLRYFWRMNDEKWKKKGLTWALKALVPAPREWHTVLTPDSSPELLEKRSKKCSSPGIFWRIFSKIWKKSQNITVREWVVFFWRGSFLGIDFHIKIV